MFVRVIARGTLNKFVENRVDRAQRAIVKAHLDAWYEGVAEAQWMNSAGLKSQHGSASILSAERVVFNIKGNDYRLIVSINYRKHILMVKWIGTHREYDRIDALEVGFDKGRYRSSTDSQ